MQQSHPTEDLPLLVLGLAIAVLALLAMLWVSA